MPYTSNYNPTLRLVKNSELTWKQLDDNFKSISTEFGSVSVAIDAAELRILAVEQATGISTVAIQNLADLLDVDNVAPTTNNILSFNGTSWAPKASPELTAFGFNTTTGELAITSNIGNLTTNLDGRYVRSVNGVVPVSGDITLDSATTKSGTLVARPAAATNGVVYVVSGDTPANNGKAFVWTQNGASGTWHDINSGAAGTASQVAVVYGSTSDVLTNTQSYDVGTNQFVAYYVYTGTAPVLPIRTGIQFSRFVAYSPITVKIEIRTKPNTVSWDSTLEPQTTDPSTWPFDNAGSVFRNDTGQVKALVAFVYEGDTLLDLNTHYNSIQYSWLQGEFIYATSTVGANRFSRWIPVSANEVVADAQFICDVTIL